MKATIASLGSKTIKEHLLFAQSKGVKYPRLVFGKYKFTLAPLTGKNAGAVYVKTRANGLYLGKVIDSIFYPAFPLEADIRKQVQDTVADPLTAATVHGQQTGTCCCCGRELTAESSINAMIGPICAEKYGF